jgi:tannase/feruloyl esterase
MAGRYQLKRHPTGWEGVQSFYRLFHVPGVGHCGIPVLNPANGQLGPWPQNGADFNALIQWVENGIAPDQVIGTGRASGPRLRTRARQWCHSRVRSARIRRRPCTSARRRRTAPLTLLLT